MIFHLVAQEEWEAAGEHYSPASLESEGFVHCSSGQQLARVANTLFAGRRDLLVLEIDPDMLDAPVVWEDLYELGEEFPHVYGPIPRGAVAEIADYRPGADGTFS